VYWLWATLGIIAATLVSSAIICSLTVIIRDKAARVSIGWRRDPFRNRAGLHPHLPWFLVSRYLMITAIFVFPTYGLFFLRDVVGADNPPQTLATMILCIGGALVISVYPAGWLSDRIGRKPVVIFGGLAAALASLALLTADTSLEVLLIASIAGAAVGTLLSASWALANELGTEGREGQHMGIVNLATIAGAASAKVFGPGVDLLNLALPGYGYSALLSGCGAAFLVGALLILPLNPRPHRPEGNTEH
jgi:MFS family permease